MSRLVTTDFEVGTDAHDAWSSQEGTSFSILETGGPSGIVSNKSKNGKYSWLTQSTSSLRIIPTPVATGTFYHKFHFLYTKNGQPELRAFLFDEAPGFGWHARYQINASGNIVANGNSATGATATGTIVLQEDTWYEISIEHIGSNTGLMRVWVDGVLDIDLSTDTRRSDVVDVGQWRYGTTAAGYDYYYDNVFLNDNLGDKDNTLIPFGTVIKTLRPVHDSTINQWTPDPPAPFHYLNVISDPFETSTIESVDKSQVTLIADVSEIFNLGKVTREIPIGSQIKSCNVIATTYREGTSQQKLLIRLNGTSYLSDNNAKITAAGPRPSLARFTENPETQEEWKRSELNSILVGSYAVSNDDILVLADIGLMIEYIPPTENLYVGDIVNDILIKSDLDGNASDIIVNNPSYKPWSVDIDIVGSKIYWTQASVDSNYFLVRSELDGSSIEPMLYIGGSARNVLGITIDSQRRTIFLSDVLNKQIIIYNINDNESISFNRSINLSDALYSIEIDEDKNILFGLSNSKILKIYLDKDDLIQTIKSGEQIHIYSIAIDRSDEKIYYSSIDDESIKSINYFGGNEQTVIPLTGSPTIAESKFDSKRNSLYFNSSFENRLYRYNIDTDVTSTILDTTDGLSIPVGLGAYFFDPFSTDISMSLFIQGASGDIEEIDNTDTPDPIILEETGELDTFTLFLQAPDGLNNSLTLFIGPGNINDNLELFIIGPGLTNQQLTLFIKSPELSSNEIDLFTKGSGIIPINDSIDLFVSGFGMINNNIDLFTLSFGNISGSMDLSMSGSFIINDNIDLFINGPVSINNDLNMFVFSEFVAPSGENANLKKLYKFKLNGNYYPQIIEKFGVLTNSVTMELWNILNGENTIVDIISNVCEQVGNSNRWRWSLENLRFIPTIESHYLYRMTANTGETKIGEFIIRVI